MDKKFNMADEAEFNRIFEKTHEMTQKLAGVAMSKAMGPVGRADDDQHRGGNMVAAMTIGMAVVNGALQMVSQLVTRGNSKPTQDHLLFMGVLTALCNEPSKDGTTSAFTYTPGMIGEAMDFFERATGRKLDGILLEPMVRAAREIQRDGDLPLAAFMEARGKPH